MKTTLLSLVAITALSQTLLAENNNTENVITLEPLTISSTAIETDELRSTDAVEIYTAQDIEKAHVQNVYEFLNQQTSVIAMPSYGNPFTQKIDMHGYGIGDGYQNIVITINGRRMNNIDMVPQLLSSIAPSSIEKIEIIKSSGIVTGGDGANAGVINITTKRNNDKEITVYGGNYGINDTSVYIGYSDEKVSASANGERQTSDGIRTINANGDKDQNELKTGSFNIAYTPIKAIELRLGAGATNTEVIYGGVLTKAEFESDPFQEGNKSATEQTYKSKTFSGGFTFKFDDAISLNVDGYNETKKSEYVTYSSVSDYTYDSFRSSIDYESDLVALSIGIDGFNGRREGATNKTHKVNVAGFAMSEWYLGDSTIKAGYRYESVSYKYLDDTTDIKDEHNLHGAELGYNYTLTTKQSLFANYAHTYQAPDIDRFFTTTYPAPTFTPVVAFNGFIDPMKANNYTLGYNYILSVNKFKISTYYVDLTDEIYLAPDTSGFTYGTNTNIDKSHKYGIDIYDKLIVNDWLNIAINYNYVQAVIDKETGLNGEDYAGKNLPGVSNHNAKATITVLPISHTSVALTQVYRSAAYAANDLNNDFKQKQKHYQSTDISATYTQKTYEVFAKVNNIFSDTNGLWIKDDAIYPINYAATAIAGLKVKF